MRQAGLRLAPRQCQQLVLQASVIWHHDLRPEYAHLAPLLVVGMVGDDVAQDDILLRGPTHKPVGDREILRVVLDLFYYRQERAIGQDEYL